MMYITQNCPRFLFFAFYLDCIIIFILRWWQLKCWYLGRPLFMGFSLATGQPQWLGYDGADDQTPDRDDSTPMQLLLLLTNLESTWRQSHPPSQTARENIEDQSALSDHLKCIYDTDSTIHVHRIAASSVVIHRFIFTYGWEWFHRQTHGKMESTTSRHVTELLEPKTSDLTHTSPGPKIPNYLVSKVMLTSRS